MVSYYYGSLDKQMKAYYDDLKLVEYNNNYQQEVLDIVIKDNLLNIQSAETISKINAIQEELKKKALAQTIKPKVDYTDTFKTKADELRPAKIVLKSNETRPAQLTKEKYTKVNQTRPAQLVKEKYVKSNETRPVESVKEKYQGLAEKNVKKHKIQMQNKEKINKQIKSENVKKYTIKFAKEAVNKTKKPIST